MSARFILNNSLLKWSNFNGNHIATRSYAYNIREIFKEPNNHKSKKNEESFHTLQEELLSNAVQNYNKKFTDWNKIKNDILPKGRKINSVNFDAKVVAFCANHQNLEAAKSYIDYLHNNNIKPNIATLGRFLRLYYVVHYKQNIQNTDEEIILNIYEDLKKSCPLFDPMTGEYVIQGLSLTSKWKDSLEVLDTLKLTCNPSGATFSAISKAAFLNNEEEVGWNILNECILNGRTPQTNAYSAFLEMTSKNQTNVMNKIEELFNFFENHEVQPPKEITDEILKLIKPFGYIGKYTTIGPKGFCKCCQSSLEEVKIDKNDFENLKSVFFNKVIVGKNIFNKTTPEELNKFKEFISKKGSFDMVIDGLNVAYSAGNKLPTEVYAKMVSSVVTHFSQLSMKVLVLGRVHMQKWPRVYMDYIRSKSDVFLAQNISQDDPYLLYATMASGLGTGFLSRDFMRSHVYLLMDHSMRRIFRRWQQLHQHQLIYVEKNGKVSVKGPYKSLPTVQKHSSGWHLPYQQEFMATPPSSLDPPKHWLCIQRIK